LMIEMPFREGTLVWVTSLHSYITLHVMDSHWHCLASVMDLSMHGGGVALCQIALIAG